MSWVWGDDDGRGCEGGGGGERCVAEPDEIRANMLRVEHVPILNFDGAVEGGAGRGDEDCESFARKDVEGVG